MRLNTDQQNWKCTEAAGRRGVTMITLFIADISIQQMFCNV